MKEIITLRPVTLYRAIDHKVFENYQDAKAHEKKYLYDPYKCTYYKIEFRNKEPLFIGFAQNQDKHFELIVDFCLREFGFRFKYEDFSIKPQWTVRYSNAPSFFGTPSFFTKRMFRIVNSHEIFEEITNEVL